MERIIHPDRETDKESEPTEQEVESFKWETTIDAVAKHFRLDWDDVLTWNIIVFNHRCTFLRHQAFLALAKIRHQRAFTKR